MKRKPSKNVIFIVIGVVANLLAVEVATKLIMSDNMHRGNYVVAVLLLFAAINFVIALRLMIKRAWSLSCVFMMMVFFDFFVILAGSG